MTDEQVFWDALEKNPKDGCLELVFADWLEEQGDRRAAGVRYLGENGLRPERKRLSDGTTVFVWWSRFPGFRDGFACIDPILRARISLRRDKFPSKVYAHGWSPEDAEGFAVFSSRQRALDVFCQEFYSFRDALSHDKEYAHGV